MNRPPTGDNLIDPLLRSFLDKDPVALETVRGEIRRVVRFEGYGIPAVDQEDLVQETLLQAWREAGVPGFSFTQDFRGFVRLVGSRRCIDWRRSRRPMLSLQDEPVATSGSPDDLLLSAERLEIARGALARLGDSCRDLIQRHLHEGQSYGTIARLTGGSEGSLRTRMWGCLKEARRIAIRLADGRRSDRRGGSDDT